MSNSPEQTKSKKVRTAQYAMAKNGTEQTIVKGDKPEYKLTFARLIELLTTLELDRNNPRYRNRITKQPMIFAGRSTFEHAIGFPSAGTFQYYFDKMNKQGKPPWNSFNPRVYLGIWLFLQLAETKTGKGVTDPSDLSQREIRSLFPHYSDIMRLHAETLPDARELLKEQNNPSLLTVFDRLSGLVDPIADLYDKIRQLQPAAKKRGISKLKNLILIYAGENDVSTKEDIAELMLLNIEEGNTKNSIKKKLVEAIAAIYKGEVLSQELFGFAIVPLSESLRDFDGGEFKTVEELISYIGLNTD